MDIPVSEGNTCILVAVDRFSKACKLIPLHGLPTALETAEHLFHQVLRNFGVPEEIGLRSTVHLPSVEGFLSTTRSLSELVAIIPRLMARLNTRSRNSDGTYGHTAKKTSSAGAVSSRGPSMHKTHHRPHSLPVHIGWESLRRFQLLTTGSGRARECGTRPTSTSSRQCGDTRPSQMLGMLQLPSINLETGCSWSSQTTCDSACPVELRTTLFL